MKKIIFLAPFLLILVGCSWFKHKADLVSYDDLKYVESGKVVDLKRLQAGGKLLISPFKAGPNVEANEYLDKVALMIVKGLMDGFKEGDAKSKLQIVAPQEADQADLILEGHVTVLSGPSKVKRWVIRDNTKNLSVKGKMVDQKTGQTILVFTDTKKTSGKTGDHKHLGSLIGQDIAKFILSGTTEGTQ